MFSVLSVVFLTNIVLVSSFQPRCSARTVHSGPCLKMVQPYTERLGNNWRQVMENELESNGVDSTAAKKDGPLTKLLANADQAKRPLAVATGTLSACMLQRNFRLASPLVAAVVVGLVSGPLSMLAAFQAPLYCGAFAGTTSIDIVNGPAYMVGLALTCVTMFEIFERRKLFPGKGGRLGMCATLTSTIFTLACGQTALCKEFAALFSKTAACVVALWSSPVAQLIGLGKLGWKTAAPAFAAASSGAVLSTFLRRRGVSPVPASAICGALGTLGIGGGAGGLFYMGSFIGMSATANDAKARPYATQILAANLAATFFLVLGQFILGGVGGKLGAAALLGVLACDSIVDWKSTNTKYKTA